MSPDAQPVPNLPGPIDSLEYSPEPARRARHYISSLFEKHEHLERRMKEEIARLHPERKEFLGDLAARIAERARAANGEPETTSGTD